MTLSRGTHLFVFSTVVLEAMSGGLIGPFVPTLMAKFSPGGLSSVSTFYGWWIAVFSLSMFVAAPLMGQLSDRFGRRPVVLISIAGAVIDYVVAASTSSLWVFLVARALVGVCAAGAVGVQAVIVDATPAEHRARAFSLLSAAATGGSIVGPAFGGLLTHFGPAGPFWGAAVLSAVDFALGWIVLKETLGQDERRVLRPGHLNPLKSLLGLRHFQIGPLLTVFLLFSFAATAAESVFVLFIQARLGWDTGEISLFFFVAGISGFIARALLTPFAVERLGERRTVLVGICAFVLCSLWCGLISAGWEMYVALGFSAVGCMVPPTLMAMMTRPVASLDHGQLLGSLMSVQVAVGAIAAVTGTTIFSYSVGPAAPVAVPGATFLFCCSIFLVSLFLAIYAMTPGTARTLPEGSEL